MQGGTLLQQSLTRARPVGGDLVAQALEAGLIRPFAEGQWLYTETWVDLFRRVQALYVARVRRRHQFHEWLFPRLIPPQALQDFKLTHYKPGMLFGVSAYEHPDGYTGILDPVQCVPFYHHLRGQVLPVVDLPIKVVECLGGWTWRNEPARELYGPIKAREFARVEGVFVGTPDQVRQLRKGLEEEITALLSELGLSWRIVVGVGCMEIPALINATDRATNDDEVPVHDVEILTDIDEWLEISGCTVEEDHLVASFRIQRDDRGTLWSGCCGLGMNRLLSGLFLQHGFDVARWPAPVKKRLNFEASGVAHAGWTTP